MPDHQTERSVEFTGLSILGAAWILMSPFVEGSQWPWAIFGALFLAVDFRIKKDKRTDQ